MNSRITHIGAIAILLVCFASATAQQAVDESKITQMRATLQKLEGLSSDANIPDETRQQLKELLFEKRGELHVLLRQKRDALRANLQNASPAERTALNDAIRAVTQEMQQLSGTPAPTAANETAPQSLGAGSDSGNSSPPTNGGAAVTTPALPSSPAGSSVPAAAASTATQPGTAPAQPDAPQTFCEKLLEAEAPKELDIEREVDAASCRMELARKQGATTGEGDVDFRAYSVIMALTLAKKNLPNVLVPELTAEAENASHAKNVSASGSSAGSTALVAKAGLPAVFGFATEHGALTRTTSGTTVTFTGNPVGIVEALAKKGFIDGFKDQDDFTAALRRLSFGLSFDTSRGENVGTFTADKQQLSGFSFKYNLVDQRDPRLSRYQDKWHALAQNQASKLALSLNNLVKLLATPPGFPAFDAWQKTASANMKGKTKFEDIKAGWTAELKTLESLPLTPQMQALVDQVGTDLQALITERNEILDEISNGWIATFDYNNERPVTGPSLSNFRFLAEKGAYNGSIDFTGNASLTIYNSRPTTPNTQRLRDFRFAGQIDVPIGEVSKTGKWMLSFAGRYQRLLNDETLPDTSVVIRKGDIAVGQLKLTIPIRGTAVKFPLSVSFANRTELIQEKEVRGNFGVTFDLDSLLAKFNPFNRP